LDLSTQRHWEHAYASTIHAAQGKTTDRVLVHIDTKYEQTIGSESFYVAISRARREAKLYVDDRSKLTLAVERSAQKPYGLEALDHVVSVPKGRDTQGDLRR
jgi:ATP-dependent exoDNAse (exonuclease V) alpha subunit